MSLTDNLIATDDVVKGYKALNATGYYFDITINSKGLLCVVGKYGYHTYDWVSVGSITDSAKDIGDCINYVIVNSPNGIMVGPDWELFEKFNISWSDYRHLWLSTTIGKYKSLFDFRDEELSRAPEKMGMKIIKFHDWQLEECNLLESGETSIPDYLQNLNIQLRECIAKYNPSLARTYSEEIENPIGFEKLKCLGLSKNEEIQNTYKEYRTLTEKIYQAYMNEVR